MKHPIQKLLLRALACLFTAGVLFGAAPIRARAEATYSKYWFQDESGNWRVRDGAGNIVRNSWFCDDAVPSNGKNVWYLLDANGYMIPFGLVRDGTGNRYSIETNHNGYYGMLRYKSGTYDGIYLALNSNHGGGFASILNQEGIDRLKENGGEMITNIDNENCVYSSTFEEQAKRIAANPEGYAAAKASAEQEEAARIAKIAENFNADQYAQAVFKLTNAERAKAGIDPVIWNSRNLPVAKLRVDEAKRSFTHARPDGTHFWTAFDALGITDYIAVGENIAMGQKTPEAVMNAWMNSESHRENILNPNYRELTVYCDFNNGSICWTQEFYTQRKF